MGNAWLGTHFTEKEYWPKYDGAPRYDPLYGFPEGREQRVMKLTHAEMVNAKISHKFRDYCAHLHMDCLVCKRNNFPFTYKCAPELHAYFDCEREDYLDRFREYERERRLLQRKKRIEERQKVNAEKERLAQEELATA